MLWPHFTRCAALLIVLAMPQLAAAQQPQLAPPALGVSRGSSPSLSGPWQQTLQAFNQWAAVQQIYTPQQISNMRRQMLEKATGLSPQESEQFRGEVEAKLHVLMSAEARDARKWLTETLAVASDSYAAKVRAGLPDVVHESASQLQADLTAFENREASVKQYQQGMQQMRERQIKAIEDDARQQAEASAQARATNNSNYNPFPGGGTVNAYDRYRSPYRPYYPISPFGNRFWW